MAISGATIYIDLSTLMSYKGIYELYLVVSLTSLMASLMFQLHVNTGIYIFFKFL